MASVPDTLGSPVARKHASDHVFEELGEAIITGKLAVGSGLPPERELAARFHVSRAVVRQAIYRLKDLGLVRVRQGGQTVVLDPASATDPRVLGMVIAALPGGERESDLADRQLLAGATLIELAERKATPEEVAGFAQEVDAFEASNEEHATGFESRFWVRVAESTKNRILVSETRWWFQFIGRAKTIRVPVIGDKATRIAFYRAVIARFHTKESPGQFYLDMIRPFLGQVGSVTQVDP